MNRYPPGPKGHGLFGNLPQMKGDPLGFIVNAGRTYGDIVHLRLNPFVHTCLLNHPDYIRYVLVDAPEKFHKSPVFKRSAGKVIGNGLLLSEDGFHKRQRKLVQPAFHQTRISSYGSVMVDHTLRMLDGWQPGEVRDIHREMMRLTMGIVCKALFDADVSSDADDIGDAITVGLHAVNEQAMALFTLPDWVPTAKNRQWRHADKVMKTAVLNIIDDRRASGEDKGDLLSMLLLSRDEDDGQQMTDQQVHDEAITLFIAGHETTANALSWTWYLLSQHRDVEAKLMDELGTVLAGRAPTMADLPRLPYTDMVIKESMRLYPPAWIIIREAVQPLNLGGYDIARGSILLMCQWAVQRDPRYFEDPDAFRPERFADEKTIPKYAYFPFGGGPRICIGQAFAMMEARLILATVAQHYRPTLLPGRAVELEPLVTLRPRHGIQMSLVPRQVVESASLAQ